MRVKRTPSYVLLKGFFNFLLLLIFFSEFVIRYFVQMTTIDTKKSKKGFYFTFAQRLTGQKSVGDKKRIRHFYLEHEN